MPLVTQQNIIAKLCSQCGEPVTDHYKGKPGTCKACHIKRTVKWARRNKESRRGSQLRYNYGIEPEEFEAALQGQGGLCPICGAKDPTNADHDHETGKFRGVLCGKCNRGLGHFNDQPELLERALEYLKCP